MSIQDIFHTVNDVYLTSMFSVLVAMVQEEYTCT